MAKPTLKRVPLKTVDVKRRGADEPKPLSYAETFLFVLDAPPAGGFLPSVMRERLPIADRIENATAEGAKFVLLDTKQHATLSGLVDAHAYGIASYAILEMIDAVKSAPDQEVAAVEGGDGDG